MILSNYTTTNKATKNTEISSITSSTSVKEKDGLKRPGSDMISVSDQEKETEEMEDNNKTESEDEPDKDDDDEVPFEMLYNLYNVTRNDFKKRAFRDNNSTLESLSSTDGFSQNSLLATPFNITTNPTYFENSELDKEFATLDLSEQICSSSESVISENSTPSIHSSLSLDTNIYPTEKQPAAINMTKNNEIANSEMLSSDEETENDRLCNEAYDTFCNVFEEFNNPELDKYCQNVLDQHNSLTSTASTSTNKRLDKETRKKVFYCPICAETCLTYKAASDHCMIESNSRKRKPVSEVENPPQAKKNQTTTTTSNSESKDSKSESANKTTSYKCKHCSKTFGRLSALLRHARTCKTDPLPEISTKTVGQIRRKLKESAINGHVQNIRFENIGPSDMLSDEFFSNAEPLIQDTLSALRDDNHFSKIAFSMNCTYKKKDDEETEEEKNYFHHIGSEIEQNINIDTVQDQFNAQIATFNKKGTGFWLSNVKYLEMNITSRYTISHHVGSMSGPVTLPKSLKGKNAVINVQLNSQNENECFKYAILAALHSNEVKINKSRSSLYHKFASNYNWTNIKFPATTEDTIKFQRQNPGIFINLFTYENDTSKLICPAKIPQNETELKGGKFINIMAVYIKEKDTYHYVAVTHINRLLNNKEEGIRFNWCERCIQHFARGSVNFEKHRKECYGLTYPSVRMPKENTIIEFKNYSATQRIPYVVYCDIECCLDNKDSNDVSHKPYALGVMLCPQKTQKTKLWMLLIKYLRAKHA